MRSGRIATLAAIAAAACAPSPQQTASGGVATADSIVRAWVDSGRVPGAVLLASRDDEVLLDRAYGFAQLFTAGASGPVRLPQPVPMTTETMFDLASVTKVMATTMAVMLLVERGELDVEAPVSRYLSDFTGDGKEAVTLRHLLTHRAGLYQWQPTYYHASSSTEAYAYIRDLPLNWPVGTERHYSDLGFMLLGLVVEEVSGTTLDHFLQVELYERLGLDQTGFRPTRGVFAATSHGNPFERRMVYDAGFGYEIEGDPEAWDGWRRYTLSGEVNDGNAFYTFGGVAGHAGLFSTAAELRVLLELLLDGGMSQSGRLLRQETIDRFMTPTGDGQALGWQLPDYAPDGSFAHTGFTGTFVLGVPDQALAIVLLTNRQNGGVDQDTNYPDVAPLQRAVTAALAGSD